MSNGRLIGAAIRCYWYISGLLLGKSSVRTVNSDDDSDRGIGNLNKVDLPLPDTRNVFSLAWPLAVNAIMLNGIVIVDTFLVSTLGEGALASMGLAAVVIAETMSQSVSCYFNGTGRTKLPFYSHLVEIPVNVGLSIVLIYGLYGFPEFGLTGAAIGSAAAAAVRMLFLVWFIFKKDRAVICVAGWSQTTLASSSQRHFMLALPIAATFFLDDFLSRVWRFTFALAALVSLLYLGASLSFDWIYDDLLDETRDALWSFVPVLLLLSFPKSSNAVCGHTLRAGGDTVYVIYSGKWRTVYR